MGESHIKLHSATAEPRFYVSVGTTQNGIKFGTVRSRKYCSYGHMVRAIQKLCKLAENKMQKHKLGVLLYFVKIC
jgi:hypothetical protein